ncbi:MAG: Co2+/Mg2+ efflux protein ApaG [Cyclobacteriaceae bacterium]|nr:Co2+/Mg2+ efflux protein ApaG [Cyclobacteriaceae bacterium HetDA_MAG_MS6]
MTTDTTKGVRVTVETEYQPEYSNPAQQHFVFTYRITIENRSENTIQLLSRHWEIMDITFPKREVEGEGVVGKQPVLEPGQVHQYVSGCNLKSGLGKMTGFYTMEKVIDGKFFNVNIPEFTMVVPFKLN